MYTRNRFLSGQEDSRELHFRDSYATYVGKWQLQRARGYNVSRNRLLFTVLRVRGRKYPGRPGRSLIHGVKSRGK
jgi:hypothetical protein